jgi:hypothetical protein
MKPVTAGKLQSGSGKVSNPFAEPLVAESKVASEDSARTNPGATSGEDSATVYILRRRERQPLLLLRLVEIDCGDEIYRALEHGVAYLWRLASVSLGGLHGFNFRIEVRHE